MKANFRLRIEQNKVVHIRRNLPGKGTLKVSQNQEVTPDDILGSYTVDAGFSSVNLAKEMGASPQSAMKYLQVPLGRYIYKGELLAFKKSFLGDKVVTAPTDGLIEEYNPKTGDLRLKFLSKELLLTSGVFGIVDSVDQRSGEVLIRSMVTQIFGVLGSGRERSGILEFIGNSSSLVNNFDIKPEMNRRILVSGALIYGEALRKAAVVGAAGVICGGLNLADYLSIASTLNPHDKLGTDVGISILATEGFGLIPIGADIFETIKGFSGRYVFLNGNGNSLTLPSLKSDSILTIRKTVLPILPVSKVPILKPELEIQDIKIGSKVRLIWPPFMGAQGKVLSLDQSPTVLESGLSTILLTVETANKKLKVPFPNVELI